MEWGEGARGAKGAEPETARGRRATSTRPTPRHHRQRHTAPPPAPLPTTTHTTHATRLSASPLLASPPGRTPVALHRQRAARPRSPPSTRRRGGRVRTPRRTQPGPRHRTLLATIPGDSPSHPRHRPPEEGGEEHSLLWALLPPRARNQAGHGQPAKPGLVNDPSAGSPTETLLRLLLPLDSQVRPSSQRSARAVGRPRRGRSEGLTKPSNR